MLLSPSGIIGYGGVGGSSGATGGYLCYPDDEMMSSTASTTAPEDDEFMTSAGGDICDYSSINNDYRTTPNPTSPEQPPNTTYVCL